MRLQASGIAFIVLVSAAAHIVGVPRLQFCRVAKTPFSSSVARGAPVFCDVGVRDAGDVVYEPGAFQFMAAGGRFVDGALERRNPAPREK